MSRTRRRSPEVRSTAFTARPPDLPPRLLMAVDFAITCSLVQPGRPRYPVLVHQAAALLRASFSPRLAAAPLRFANPSPPSGWIEDFHLQALDHARHTRKAPPKRGKAPSREHPCLTDFARCRTASSYGTSSSFAHSSHRFQLASNSALAVPASPPDLMSAG